MYLDIKDEILEVVIDDSFSKEITELVQGILKKLVIILRK